MESSYLGLGYSVSYRRNAVFGSANYGYRPVRVLQGHESGTYDFKCIDVVDLAWSFEGAHLASCGLDAKVIIWDVGGFGNILF